MYHKKNVDYAYLLCEDFVYQQYSVILPKELTNEDIKKSESYTEYYNIASGAEPPKSKASVKKKRVISDTTMPAPTTKAKRIKTLAKAFKKGWKGMGHQPNGFVDTDKPNHVYKLKKALYGLKQASRAWYDMLSSFLISQDFSKGLVDPTLFIYRDNKELLSVQIYYGFESCDPVDTSMVEKSKLDEDKEAKAVDPSHYHGMIGTLLYLIANRPDLQFDICMCSQYQARPIEKHLHTVKRIFRYLRGTINRGLWSKHIDIRYHFIKEHVDNGVIELYFVNTKYQLVDIFTKDLGRERIKFLINKLGMRSFTLETLKQLTDEVDK
nr:hypothetical protein [Tanacetum cinerariifolium]